MSALVKSVVMERDARALKISKTMKWRKINNFSAWMEKQKIEGKIPDDYPALPYSPELAEYIGVVLGDGHIAKFPRTERITISCNSANQGFIDRYALLTKNLFKKDPTVEKVKNVNNVRIHLYQKYISKRLGIPSGNRKELDFKAPQWIVDDKDCLIGFLRGLFEAEGSLSIHLPTCTYNFQFCNYNPSLLSAVENGLISLGYHPEVRKKYIRLRKKAEVASFRDLIKFRVY